MDGRALTLHLVRPWMLLLLAVLPAWLRAQTGPTTPYQHRALYLYNFAKFTQWPKESFPDSSAPFVLGILGQDPFGDDINIIRGKLLKNRPIVVKKYSNVAEVDDCHLLFISSSEITHLEHILLSLEKRPILTVSEVENGTPGAIINLFIDKKFLAFEINNAAAEKAGLKLDTQLLRLARSTKNHKEVSP